MTISEKVAYIRGLADGLTLDPASSEGKLFNAIIDILGDIAADLEDVEENALDIGEELDALSDDLADVENFVFGGDDDDDEDDDEACGFDFDEDEFVYTVTCPSCNEEITVSEDIINLGEMDCPNCGENLEFDVEEEDDED